MPRKKAGSKKTTGRRRRPATTAPKSAPPVESDAGLAELEEQFRTFADRTAGSLHEQSTAFDAVLRAAQDAVRDRAALASEVTSLDAQIAALNEERDELRASLYAHGRDARAKKSGGARTEADHEALAERCRQNEEQIDALTRANEELMAANGAFETDLAETTSANLDLEAKLDDLRAQADETSDATPATDVAAPNERVMELETEVSFLRTELEAAVARSYAADVTTGLPPSITRTLVRLAKWSDDIVELLRQPALDSVRREQLMQTAYDLTVDLNLMTATAEMAEPDAVIEVAPDVFDLHRTFQETLEMLGPATTRRGFRLMTRMDPALPTRVHGDEGRLRQLLGWAIAFMIRHSAQGDIAINIGAEGVTNDGTIIRIHLFNDGIGLSSDKLDELVTPTPAGAIADGDGRFSFQRLAEAMGGDLRIERAGKQGFALRVAFALGTPATGQGNRRVTRRVLQELLQSSLGSVVDLSDCGMRVICGRIPPRRSVTVDIRGSHRSTRVHAYIVWAKQVDPDYYEIGLRFLEVSPELAGELEQIAAKHGLLAAG